MTYKPFNERLYPPDPLRWDINLCDNYFKGDLKPHEPYLVQSIYVDIHLEKTVKYIHAVLEAYKLVMMGPDYSGAFSQYYPKNKKVINATVTQWCLILEGRLLQ